MVDVKFEKKILCGQKRTLYGRLADLEKETVAAAAARESPDEAKVNSAPSGDNPGGTDGSAPTAGMADYLRNLSHLSTITENQNSPYSTNPGSRRNSKPYPTAEGVFAAAAAATSAVPGVASSGSSPSMVIK